MSSPHPLPPSDPIRPPSDPIRPDLAPAGMENLVSLVNKLQRACTALGDHGEESALPTLWDALPSIVVVGCQGCGKSSVLESIVGKDFLPKGMVTRRPLVLQLRRIEGTGEYAEFLHQPRKRYTDFAEVRKEIADETDRETGRSKAISSVPIHLSIFSPNVVNLTLIDLPGLTKVAVDGQSDSIVQDIENMVRAFIEKPNSIILAVSPANQDLATSDAIKIALEVDPKGEMTFGVLTKIDLMDKGTDAVNILEGRSYKLLFRWIGVINRSQLDIDNGMDMTAARLRERDYFANTPDYKHIAHRMGLAHLGMSLSKHLEDITKSSVSASKLFYKCNINSGDKKNRLQGYTLRSNGSFPTYIVSTTGYPGNILFSCKVLVRVKLGQEDDAIQGYHSLTYHTHLKEAEEDAAAVACKALLGEDTIDTILHIIDEGKVCLVSVLKEFALKKNLGEPVFASSIVSGTSETIWLSTVEIDGQLYLGEQATSKKRSAQKAASTAIKSLLDDGDTLMITVLQGKRLLNALPLKLRKYEGRPHRKRRKTAHI